MVMPFLLPVPYLALMLFALLPFKKRALGYLGSLAGIATALLAALSWGEGGTLSVPWFALGNLEVSWSVLLDPIGLLMAALVGVIGAFVFLYSTRYFESEEDLGRYYFLLSLFASSMVALLTAGNLLQLFLCWELVGVSSFLLIGFWKRKPSAMRAARKAFLTIALADAIFLAGLLALYAQYRTFDIVAILSGLRLHPLTVMGGIGILAGALSKSAQFPLHDWLPDAMEGPTPVSAFLHSAAMVKAGLYLVARFLPLLAIAGLLPWLALAAILTLIVSSTLALVENDLKRVLAYSTMNHLAIILLSFSAGALAAGMFHLLAHSVFKALLFFCAGIAIHTARTQDLREIRIRPRFDIFTLGTIAGILSLAGLFPLSGFFSKEAVLSTLPSQLAWLMLAFVLLGSAYGARWAFLLFDRKGKKARSSWEMLLPLPVLAVASIFGGIAASWVFMTFGGGTPHLWGSLTIPSILAVLAGIALAYLVVVRSGLSWLAPLAEGIRGRYLFPQIENALSRMLAQLAGAVAWVDGAIVDGAARRIGSFGLATAGVLRRMHTGSPATLVVMLVFGFLLLLFTVRWLA